MSVRPPSVVVSAIESGEATITRRSDFFESDGVTPWYPNDDTESRLIDGSVTVDYGRDERRGLDIQLDNIDNALRPDPEDGLWYDKIIKPYRGVTIKAGTIQPKIVIIDSTVANGNELRATLNSFGYSDITIYAAPASIGDLEDYDIVIAYKKDTASSAGILQILQDAWNSGKGVIYNSTQQNQTSIPTIWATSNTITQTFSFQPTTRDNPLQGGWSAESGSAIASRPQLLTVASGVTVVATKQSSSDLMGAIATSVNGGRWFSFAPPTFNTTNSKALLANAMGWIARDSEDYVWETQLGEFMIDSISEDYRPNITKITGRDYTKKCLVSKFAQTLSFDPETPISTFVRALAANAGVTKFMFPDTVQTIGSGMVFDRTTERWNAMKQACESNNYELFFNEEGFLVMREYYDPTTSPFSQSFKTGVDGNLVDWSRSTNDSRLYNHVIVTGDSGQESVPPFFGEAINDEPSSPTRIGRIGDRSYFYTSSFFTSDQQCVDLARRWLKEKALESYEISWSAINYPWMEVGEIIEFLDPRRLDHEPTRFLMDTLNIPLSLGPMSATAKRVTYVDDSGLVT